MFNDITTQKQRMTRKSDIEPIDWKEYRIAFLYALILTPVALALIISYLIVL